MSTASTRVAFVRTAQRQGPSRPTEDRVFTTPNAVIVLDGASQPDPSDHDGGWLADTLGRQLVDELTREDRADLASILGDSIDRIAREYHLVPGGPSTTVSIVRWNENVVEALVLGDSPVIALARDGEVHQLRDDRLRSLAAGERHNHVASGFSNEPRQSWRKLVDAERARRNRPDGYWIAEAVPEAAAHALLRRWHRDDLDVIMVMTDGVAAGVDKYGTPPDWLTAATIARAEPARLLELIHETEASDTDGIRWPRSKRHDDKALAVIEFDRPQH